MQSEFQGALEGSNDLDKKIVKLGELKNLAYKNLILLINMDSQVRNNTFEFTSKAQS